MLKKKVWFGFFFNKFSNNSAYYLQKKIKRKAQMLKKMIIKMVLRLKTMLRIKCGLMLIRI